MRYINFHYGNGYCGCDDGEVLVYDDSVTDELLDEELHNMMMENAESYEYIVTGWRGDWESDEEREEYYENCTGGWEEITEEEYNEMMGY